MKYETNFYKSQLVTVIPRSRNNIRVGNPLILIIEFSKRYFLLAVRSLLTHKSLFYANPCLCINRHMIGISSIRQRYSMLITNFYFFVIQKLRYEKMGTVFRIKEKLQMVFFLPRGIDLCHLQQTFTNLSKLASLKNLKIIDIYIKVTIFICSFPKLCSKSKILSDKRLKKFLKIRT